MAVTYWITGFSGSGKTTVGKIVVKRLREAGVPCVHLDGDTMREVFGGDLGYSRDDRFKSAMRFSRLCKMISDQGITVVCCTISMFDAVRDWNRTHIPEYVEVFLDVPLDVLQARDQKGLYSGQARGDNSDVVGLDLRLETPKAPDLVIVNDGTFSPSAVADKILERE